MLFNRTHAGTVILLEVSTVISFAQIYSAWHVTFPVTCDSGLPSKTPRSGPMISTTNCCLEHWIPIAEFP